jgi:hypothetical protein
MEEKEYIVLLEFNSIEDGVNFMTNKISPFSFYASGKSYDSSGNEISITETTDIINGYIHVDIHQEPVMPGEFYINNGFLKYYKLINLSLNS